LLVVGEALVVGVLGSALGIFLGILLGQEAVRLVTRTINDLYFVVTVRDLPISTVSLLKGFMLGVLATVATAAFPAREAAAVPPRAALSRSGLGALALAIPDGGLALSFGATLAVVIGFAALTPATTKVFMRWLLPFTESLGGLLGRLAPRNVVNALSRTSIAVAALMVAVSVTIGISLMVGSFRFTVESWLAQTLQGDVYISPPGVSGVQSGGSILPEILDVLENWPQVAGFLSIRVVQIDSPYGPIQVGATDNTGEDSDRQFASASGTNAEIAGSMAEGSIVISEPLARRLDIPFQGGSLTLQTPQGARDFPIAGVYYDYGNTQGMALMDLEVYRRIWGDYSITAVSVDLEPGASAENVTRSLQDGLTPLQQLQISPNLALRRNALEVFDRTFAITSALQGLATLVAFVGVLSALLSMQLEKARELGVLRAIGLTGRQLRRLVLYETGLMGAVAGLLSMPTGFALSLILIYIINRRAFGWTLQMRRTCCAVNEVG
jgi:putative ABC transport system permease protein